jgi:hypothetical protein
VRTIRYTAAAATILMSLMNLPFAVDDGGQGLPTPVAWLISLLGVVGLVAAVALIARRSWGPPAVIAVGAVNLVGAVFGLATGVDGAVIGLVVSALGTGLGIASARLGTRPGLTTA